MQGILISAYWAVRAIAAGLIALLLYEFYDAAVRDMRRHGAAAAAARPPLVNPRLYLLAGQGAHVLGRYFLQTQNPNEYADVGRQEIYLREPLTIGRAKDNSLWIDDSRNATSRYHARILVENGVVVVEDLGSSNGTRVNGVHLQGKRNAEGACLAPDRIEAPVGAMITVGNVVLKVEG